MAGRIVMPGFQSSLYWQKKYFPACSPVIPNRRTKGYGLAPVLEDFSTLFGVQPWLSTDPDPIVGE